MHVHVLIFLTCVSLPAVRSVSCQWTDSILSEGVCFLYNSTRLTYLEAKSACQSKGGVLAKVTSMTQVYDTTKQSLVGESVWIGANDIDIEGTWVWEDNSTFATEFWANYTLTNYSDATDCASIFVSSTTLRIITNQPCYIYKYFLCMEKAVTANPEQVTSTITTNDPTTTKATEKVSLTSTQTTSTTETNYPAITKSINNASLSSTSTEKIPITTLIKSGAYFIVGNALLILNVCAFIYLVI